jgi:hypothetical protein
MDPCHTDTPTSSKRGRAAKIWDFFSKLGETKAKCESCLDVISCKTGQTTSMRRHLEAKHPVKFSQLKESELSTKKARPETQTQLKIGECVAKLSLSKEKKVKYT